MKFISVQPDSDFYLWQLKVQMSNFNRFGIEQDAIILLAYKDQINPKALEFAKSTKARVEFIQDTRVNPIYIPSVRPHVLSKFFNKNQVDKFFYHDADMIFTTSLPDFESMNEEKVYVSDTISYLGARYIKSKGENLFLRMCSLVGIDPALVEVRNNSSGGAQYYFNTLVTSEFWSKVENDCEALYRLMTSTIGEYSPKHPIQSWTADMWAVLWNIWLLGIETEVHKELSFCWPTEYIESWSRHKIFHNAGVNGNRPELFYKGAYHFQSPFTADLSGISPEFCSFNYVSEFRNRVI